MPETAEVFERVVATELGEGITVTAKRDISNGDMIVRCWKTGDPPKLIICIDEDANEILTHSDREQLLGRLASIASEGWSNRSGIPPSEEYGGVVIRVALADLVGKTFVRSYEDASATNEAMRAFEHKHANHKAEKRPEGNYYVTRCIDCGVEVREYRS